MSSKRPSRKTCHNKRSGDSTCPFSWTVVLFSSISLQEARFERTGTIDKNKSLGESSSRSVSTSGSTGTRGDRSLGTSDWKNRVSPTDKMWVEVEGVLEEGTSKSSGVGRCRV